MIKPSGKNHNLNKIGFITSSAASASKKQKEDKITQNEIFTKEDIIKFSEDLERQRADQEIDQRLDELWLEIPLKMRKEMIEDYFIKYSKQEEEFKKSKELMMQQSNQKKAKLLKNMSELWEKSIPGLMEELIRKQKEKDNGEIHMDG